jgi:probable rRNA maturation factor
MIELDNQTSLPVPLDRIQNIHDHLSDLDVELLVVDRAQMHEINLTQRNVDKATDVLSFPFGEHLAVQHLGSIIICADYVHDLAQQLSHSEDDEFCLLFIHGLLHLLGYDHETDQGEMREKEAQVIDVFQLPNSLIIRNQEN